MKPDGPKEIIGSTVVPEAGALPLRLTPIGRDGERYLLQGDGEEWIEEDGAWVEEGFTHGDFHRLPTPLPHRPGHALVQFDANAPPEQVPLATLPTRLARARDTALAAGERALQAGRADIAETHAWVATRATPSDPLSVRLLAALLRDTVPPDQLALVLAAVPAADPWPRLTAIEHTCPTVFARILADPLLASTPRARLRALDRPPRPHAAAPLFQKAA